MAMRILLSTTAGDIEITLDAERAPVTVENFVRYARDGHYDGTVFHRVIDGFMIQGGGFEPGMRQKPTGSSIANEADNGLLNANGTVAMARTQDPHSASAQFFINTQDNDFLNHKAKTPEGWGYCVFGRVSAGMDVVTAIEECATTVRAGHRDVPEQDVIIERAQVLED
jgi:peptidyl-prolyl cis-trans isomerase B (cyclophilin B)